MVGKSLSMAGLATTRKQGQAPRRVLSNMSVHRTAYGGR
jgi:hypothetical protein